MIVSPYDAELFEHNWFEGPEFLMSVFEEMDKYKVVEPLTPIEYLAMFETNPRCQNRIRLHGGQRVL